MLDYGRIAATGESGRVEHYRKVVLRDVGKKCFNLLPKQTAGLGFFLECRFW